MQNKIITILTPTYNREKYLNVLYQSLIKQTNQQFKWLIVDDGSTDNTEEYVSKIIDEGKLDIIYFKKKNGGKHTALNLGFKKLDTELFIIVDSDDYLIDTAIEKIIDLHEIYKENNKLAGYVFLKGYSAIKSVTNLFKEDEFIANYNSYIINENLEGDKAEVFKSKVFKTYKFDEFKGEIFIGEGYLWSEISKKYDMVFKNQIIYICEYLEQGLTKAGRAFRIKNPLGGMRHAREYIDKIFNIKIAIKNLLLYIAYSKFANISFKEAKNGLEKYKLLYTLTYPFGVIIYILWKKKYLGEN